MGEKMRERGREREGECVCDEDTCAYVRSLKYQGP